MRGYIIIFFLLAIALYLWTHYIKLKNNLKQEKIEAFQSATRMTPIEKLHSIHGISLIFLSAHTASQQMQSQAREYIALMNQPNLLARGAQTQKELLSAYTQSFLDITTEEQHRVIEFILELLSKVQYKYPAYYRYLCKWLSHISLAKATSSLEGGMPHTIGNIIIMDKEWFSKPRITTLLHEITHIHQRQVPFEFEDIYSLWGYVSIPMNEVRGMEPVVQLNRNNPDGTSPNWLWKEPGSGKYWWIGAVFNNAIPQNMGDISLIAIKIEQDAQGNFYYLKQQPLLLNNLTSFINYFGGMNPNNYHPNEMTAKFAEWYIEEILGIPHRVNNLSSGYLVFKNNFNKLLETYY